MPEKRRLAAVIFDLDGTLVDTIAFMADGMALALEARLGRRITLDEFLAQIGPGAGTEQHILRTLGGGDDPAAYAQFLDWYAREHVRVQLFPGMAAAIRLCQQAGVPLGIMTGKGRATAEITLREVGLLEAFAVIVTGDEATRPKPDPLGLHIALAALAVDPRATLFCGDTRADVLAGQAAGTLTGLCAWHHPTDAAEVAARFHPDQVFATGDDLVAWLHGALASHD